MAVDTAWSWPAKTVLRRRGKGRAVVRRDRRLVLVKAMPLAIITVREQIFRESARWALQDCTEKEGLGRCLGLIARRPGQEPQISGGPRFCTNRVTILQQKRDRLVFRPALSHFDRRRFGRKNRNRPCRGSDRVVE